MSPEHYKVFLSERLIKKFKQEYFEKVGVVPEIYVRGLYSDFLDDGVSEFDLKALYSIVNQYCPDDEDLRTRKRTKRLVELRHIFFHIAKSLNYTVTEIGRFMGQDHTTVTHGVQQFQIRYMTDERFQQLYESIVNVIKLRYGSSAIISDASEKRVDTQPVLCPVAL